MEDILKLSFLFCHCPMDYYINLWIPVNARMTSVINMFECFSFAVLLFFFLILFYESDLLSKKSFNLLTNSPILINNW